MGPAPTRRAASKRRNRRRRRRRAAADAATGPGSDVLAAEQGGAVNGNAAAAASSSSRRRKRRRRRQRNRAAKAAAEASKSPEPHDSDVVSIQGDSSQQSGCVDAVLSHSSVGLPQKTTKKIVNSKETRERKFQAGNKNAPVYSRDGAVSYSLSHENFVRGIEDLRTKFFKQFDVRYGCHNITASGNADADVDYQNEDPGCLVMRKTKSSEISDETSPNCSSLQELEEYKENENGAPINSTILREEKNKRKKRKGRKRRGRCKKTTSLNCLLSTSTDDSGLVVMVSEENTSCPPMINSVSVDDAKTKEDESVHLDSTSTERNKLQEQDVTCSQDDNTSCLSPSNSAEVYEEKLELVFSQGWSFIGFPKKKLLILDLNGLLADINQDKHNAHMADAKVRGRLVFRRPYCDDFLKFCSLNFDLGIWSSRKRENVASVVNIVMRDFRPRLLFCWDMSKCTFTGCKTLENMHKPLMLKELRKLWNKEEPDLPWEEGDYSPSNTLLVDDSPYKALLNPPHTAIFPRPYSYLNLNDNSLGPGGDIRVYLQNLAAADDVESYVRKNPFGQPFITESDPNWNFYAQIAEKRNTTADKGVIPLTCSA